VADKTFQCTILTPERSVLDTAAISAAIPAADGEIGILRDRAPLLCRLGIGVLRLETPEGPRRVFVDAGFAEVIDNELTVLTPDAAFAEDIDADAERAAEAAARQRHATTLEEQSARQRDLDRARARLRLVGAA
jgi:F-type H+-transporting ATPase subunit epsilon